MVVTEIAQRIMRQAVYRLFVEFAHAHAGYRFAGDFAALGLGRRAPAEPEQR